VRLVVDRMPDRGKRGKDIAILQMGQDAYRKISKIRNCVTWVTTKLFLHTRTRYVASWHFSDASDHADDVLSSGAGHRGFNGCEPCHTQTLRLDGVLYASNALPKFLIFRNRLDTSPETAIDISPSRPTEGRIRIVRDAGRDAVDAAALGAQANCRAGFGLSRTRER
jgi:hypothetical protein